MAVIVSDDEHGVRLSVPPPGPTSWEARAGGGHSGEGFLEDLTGDTRIRMTPAGAVARSEPLFPPHSLSALERRALAELAQRVVELRHELHHALRRERAALRMRDIYRSRLEELDGTSCRACGCTESNACPGGCSWAEEDLCSRCSDEAQRRRLRRFIGLRRVYSRTDFGGPQIGWQEA